ncbi:MAG: DUF234 domain-containing protein [Campylobacteraceae bacterium]|nr:DUF234 domain-containing protein [Campylobacteraceae bacterium]
MPPEDFVEYFSVFEGFFPPLKDVNLPIHEAIDEFILSNTETLRQTIEKDLSKEAIAMLIRLARGDRKIYSVYKKEDVSQLKGRLIYRQLFDEGIITIEKSREVLPYRDPRMALKKPLRSYTIQNKIHFSNQFTRFWFTFLAGNKDAHLHKKRILREFDAYASLAFEQLSFELLALHTQESEIINQGSYWDRRHEIDLLVTLKDGRVIAGESKWKNRKVCKNVLTILQNKCQYANLSVDHFVLFSKSGFSKELLRNEGEKLWLFDISSFERLRDDR